MDQRGSRRRSAHPTIRICARVQRTSRVIRRSLRRLTLLAMGISSAIVDRHSSVCANAARLRWISEPTATGLSIKTTLAPKNWSWPPSWAAINICKTRRRNSRDSTRTAKKKVRSTGDPPRAVLRQPAARYNHVHVRVMRHCRAPGVQDRGDAKARAEMLRIGRDCDCGLGRCLEQDVVDDGLVLIRDVCDRAGQRVNDVEVWRWEQL